MKICLVSIQIFSADKIGGFGSMTLQLAKALVSAGHIVSVVLPNKKNKVEITHSNGIDIYKLPIFKLKQKRIFQQIDADVYHTTQCQSIMTTIAYLSAPDKKHIITTAYPRDFKDWINEFTHATFTRKLKMPISFLLEESILSNYAIRKADAVTSPTYFIMDKIKRLYRLPQRPVFLPYLEKMPNDIPEKAAKPTVLWIGRMAKRKRPKIAFELAGKFPEVDFWFVGMDEEKGRQQMLEAEMKKHANITYLGFKNKFEDKDFYEVYNKAWIHINTASLEGLPLTFVEATGRGCAILSYVNPDEFASNFGYWAADEDFEKGLKTLLSNDLWRKKGEQGFKYAQVRYEYESALKAHEKLYQSVLS